MDSLDTQPHTQSLPGILGMRLSHIQVSALTAAVRLLMGVRKHDDQERQGFVLRPLRRM